MLLVGIALVHSATHPSPPPQDMVWTAQATTPSETTTQDSARLLGSVASVEDDQGSVRGSIVLSWSGPSDASITHYQYRFRSVSNFGYGPWIDVPLSYEATTINTITDLKTGTTYNIRYRACNPTRCGVDKTVRARACNAGECKAVELHIETPVHVSAVSPPPGLWFLDDDGSVHEGAIEALAAAGVARGCRYNLYCPTEYMTRGQFATLLTRAFPGLAPDDADDYFGDDDGSVHETAVNGLAAAGITTGCGPGRYCPAEPMTRAQMATMLARALPGLAPPERDHFSDDDGTTHEIAINTLAHNGIGSGCGPGQYCPADPMRRDQAAALLARALDLEPTQPAPIPWRLEPVADDINGGPTDLQAPAGDDRAFLVTKQGTILVIADGAILPEPFLDLTSKVLYKPQSPNSEEGLLGLAFHPHYDTNRRFYVFYIDLDGQSQIYEYRTSPANPNRADPSTARHIITIQLDDHSYMGHAGGQLQFGANGYMYIAVGDNRINDDSQNPQTARGTILRIDIDKGDSYSIPTDNPFADGQHGLSEVWAYGLRNPWRFSFDGPNIYIADVGSDHREEINIADISKSGINYGWPAMEGTYCLSSNCIGLFTPQIEYDHNDGLAVIGGYVYRGTAIGEMTGRYFYSDFTGRWIRTFAYQDGQITEHYDWHQVIEDLGRVWSFGKDGHGELYVLTSNAVYKIVPR